MSGFWRGLVVCSVAGLLAACASESSDEGADDSAAAITAAPDPAYPTNALHSTLTPAIVASLKSVLVQTHGDTHKFIKVGDSITFSTSFLDCLGSSTVSADLEPTREYFESSWDRATKAAVVGWHTTQPITGSPSPVDTEIAAMNPAFAVVMLGTNDNDPSQVTTACANGGTCAYRTNLEKVVDTLLGKKIIPLISTIPPRENSASADARVPLMNSVVRLVAAERKIPLMDFHLALENLPGKGIGPDGIHPNAAANACDFSASGLQHGYNVRNHLVLEALDEVRAALLTDDPTTTTPAPATTGDDDDDSTTTTPAPTTTTPAADTGAIPEATLTATDDYTVVASALHCRVAAGTDQTILELLPNGAALTAVADAQDDPRVETDSTGAEWLHVTSPSGNTCYVEADFSLIAPANQ